MPLIVETIVSTVDQDGRVNFAPMGVVWTLPLLVIRPFTNTATYRNLGATREGVVNLTDNVLIFARSALTDVDFPSYPSHRVRGAILVDACAYYELVVDDIESVRDRASVRCHVVGEGWVRPFLGFNRARNAVIEAAIIATRLAWTSPEEVTRALQHYAEIVAKTGDEQEHAALAFIERYINSWVASHLRAARV